MTITTSMARTSRASPFGLALPLLAALALACSPAGGGEPDPEVFIATQPDFVGFGEWERFTLDDPQVVPNHVAGIRTIFLNERPPPEAEEFPVGTIIVKWTDADLGAQIHAMVKRGGEYNLEGAEAWEWFDLTFDDEGAVVIRWRGLAPPDGECYGCAPGVEAMSAEGGDCNTCHAAAESNDFVQASVLDLRALAEG